MAENPATWKRAELIISDALEDAAHANAHGMVGITTMKVVADRLRAAGLLNDQDEPEIGWDRLREHHAQRKAPQPDNGIGRWDWEGGATPRE